MKKSNKPVIAIIDTGIDENVSYIKDVIEQYDFFVENKAVYISDGSPDKVGHGTKVASCIKKYCPSVLLYVINIYQQSNVTYSVLLLEALKYLLKVDVDIVNISLSVNGDLYVEEIQETLRELNAQGKIIVSAVKNGLQTSFPAETPDCIGVLGMENIPINTFQINENENIQIVTSRLPEEVEALDGMLELFGGNSKATACVSGSIAALMCERENNILTKDVIYRELKKK